MLEKMLQKQKELQDIIQSSFDRKSWDLLDIQERAHWIKENVLYMQVEIAEFLQELPHFKSWKEYPENSSIYENSSLHEEYIDIMFFWLNIGLLLGLSATDIYNLYDNKHSINLQRATNKNYTRENN